MVLERIEEAIFLNRPNRFTAIVNRQGKKETVHIKNTGRLQELLLPDAKVYLQKSENENRKTRYDLVAVEHETLKTVNIDSQLPNKLMKEWLDRQQIWYKPEQKYGNSRFDFQLEDGWMEVKGVTLIQNGTARFPDAPTERGIKHLNELAKAAREGKTAILAFVIQTSGIHKVLPNDTDQKFQEAYENAVKAGVQVWAMECTVTPEEVTILHKWKQ